MRLYVAIALICCVGVVGTLIILDKVALESSIENEIDTISPDMTIDELFERGQYYFNHGDSKDGTYDLQKARLYYESILRKDLQGHEHVWYQLGRVDFIEGKFDAALYKFNKQLEYFGDRVPNTYYMIGLTYGFKARNTNNTEDWEKGEEGFIKYIEYEPIVPWPRVDLSWIYFAQGKFEEMLPVLEEGLQYEANNAWLHNMYGLALLNTNDREEARMHFEKAREEAYKLTVPDWGRAYPGNNPDEWDEGLASFRQAIEKNLELVNE